MASQHDSTRLIPKPDAVIDTNAFLTLFTPTDLLEKFDLFGPTSTQFLHQARVVYDHLALACMFSEMRMTTFQLADESMRLVQQLSPPEANSFEDLYTTVFTWHIKDQLLEGWTYTTAPGIDADVTGDQADDLLVSIAADNDIPLITNEGDTPDGVFDVKRRAGGKLTQKPNMRGKAAAKGVRVYSPGEFVRTMKAFDIDLALARFAEEYNRLAPGWLAEYGSTEPARTNLNAVSTYLAAVLEHGSLSEPSA